MDSFWSAISSWLFLQNAICGGVLTSLVCGVIGPFVHVRQIGYVAGAIAHTVLGGMGIACYLGKSPLLGAMIAAIFSAVIIGWVSLFHREREDSIINSLWAAGMALGIIFIYKTPGYDAQLLSYLFGNILMVSNEDLLLMGILVGVVCLFVYLFYPVLLAISFDENFAKIRGIRVGFYYIMLLILVAITTVLLVQIVGLILVITLLILPSAISAQFFRSLPMIIVMAILVGMFFTELGIYFSYLLNFPTGPTIILLITLVYLTIIAGDYLLKFRVRKRL
ncbi:MAG: metal ABC transporter permease [Oligoflexia bacterium]|nr:metal ABC transporter permease [Oligoflexia bacterium]